MTPLPPTQLTKLTKALIKIMAPPKMTKRGWIPTWCLSESMSVPCVSILQNRYLGKNLQIAYLHPLPCVVHQPPTLALEVGVVDGPQKL